MQSRRRVFPRSFSSFADHSAASDAAQVLNALKQAGYEAREESDGGYGGGQHISVAMPAHLQPI